MTRFYHPGEGAGTKGAGGDDATPGAGEGASANNKKGGEKSTDFGKVLSSFTEKLSADDQKKLNEKLEKIDSEADKLSAAFDFVHSDRTRLASKLGKQSDVVNKYNTIAADPFKFVQSYALEHGLHIGKSGGRDDLTKALESGDADAIKEAYAKAQQGSDREAIKAELKQEFSPVMDGLRQEYLANKHQDWDELTDDRARIKAVRTLNQMSEDEVYHYAARGMNLGEAIEAAKLEGRKELMAELEKKNIGDIDAGGGASEDEKSAKGNLDKIIAGMNAMPPGR